ncbi:hypothetical protein NLG97_g4903 [Lecanicillium saksenae]|uniref:Uncharacterized protein n=1 Tax=Lecanicillium saksenae TaxID=468837 RepID=A0ACC1QTZ0_9HYPO|nr:hypothetical protein NLG97_g4903 [Lecanicillium saksenae]
MLVNYCLLALFQISCCLSSAVPNATATHGIQILSTLDELRHDIQEYSSIINANVAQHAPAPAGNGSSDSTYEIRKALGNIISSVQTATERLAPPLTKKAGFSSEPESSGQRFEISKVLSGLIIELSAVSTRLATTSTGSEPFEDLLHILFNSLLALVNVIGDLAISIPGIEQLLRLIAALITLFPL